MRLNGFQRVLGVGGLVQPGAYLPPDLFAIWNTELEAWIL